MQTTTEPKEDIEASRCRQLLINNQPKPVARQDTNMDISSKWVAHLRETQQDNSVQNHSGLTNAGTKLLARRPTPRYLKHEPISQPIAVSRTRAADPEYVRTRPRRLWTDNWDRSRYVPRAQPAHSQPLANDAKEQETQLLLQPETQPISQDQLVAEVKGIYAGLVMVETKCIEVDNAESSNTVPNKLNNEQWQALIALHRTLLHEHHDFFLASQHPSASPPLRRLTSRYFMSARMWSHAIHSFLELLQHRLPDYLAHMMRLLYGTVLAFEYTWIECLGELGRKRMAIEDGEIRDREVWASVSRHWYCKAPGKSPFAGHLYHHLAILARPNAIQQLYYYAKSLCVPLPFLSARESIMTLFDPVMSSNPSRLPAIDQAFVRVHGILYSEKLKLPLQEAVEKFWGLLNTRTTNRWLESGFYIGISQACTLLGYGSRCNSLSKALTMRQSRDDADLPIHGTTLETSRDATFANALFFALQAYRVIRRWGDTNALPFIHTALVFNNMINHHSHALAYLEQQYPWKLTSIMLNNLIEASLFEARIDGEFPPPEHEGEASRPLPEDFAMRGLVYTEDYFPSGWFTKGEIDEDEKYFDLIPMVDERSPAHLGHHESTRLAKQAYFPNQHRRPASDTCDFSPWGIQVNLLYAMSQVITFVVSSCSASFLGTPTAVSCWPMRLDLEIGFEPLTPCLRV